MGVITQDDYRFVAGLVYRAAGINLGEDKHYLVETRLEQLCRALGMGQVSDLIARARQGPCHEVTRHVVEAMTINETSFFRDTSPFEAIRSEILPELRERNAAHRSLRIWSAACSTGQEPYSLAMLLRSHFPDLVANWKVCLLATDLAEKVLEQARSGRYSQLEVNRGLPAQFLIQHFHQRGSDWVVDDRLRAMVSFRQLNLLEVPHGLGCFDLVLCRNVLIYFDTETRRRVLASLAERVKPGGYLFLGASESLSGSPEELVRVPARTLYYRRS